MCTGSGTALGQPQARKTLLKTLLVCCFCCFNMEGILIKIHKAFVSFFTLNNTEQNSLKKDFAPVSSWSEWLVPPTHKPSQTATCVYLAMWLKLRYVSWRQLAFHTFITPSSHWCCLRCCGTVGAEIIHYKSQQSFTGTVFAIFIFSR